MQTTLTRRFAPLATGLAAAALLALPGTAGAQTKTFGADLARPANAELDCSMYNLGGTYYASPNANSCTYTGIGNINGEETFVTPSGRGTVTTVRIKAGATVGRMQVVVMRSIRHPNQGSAACCFVQRVSQEFTPEPNAVTEVTVNLPVRHDETPDPASGVYNFDSLGLSVLEPNVPVPAHETGDYSGLGNGAGAYFPHMEPGQERVDSYGIAGVQPLLNATWVRDAEGGNQPAPADQPAQGGQPAPAKQPAPADQPAPANRPAPADQPQGGGQPQEAAPAFRFASRTVRTRRGRLPVKVSCRGEGACTGLLRIQSRRVSTRAAASGRPRRRRAKRRTRIRTYATASFAIKAGKARTIRVRLTRAGRKLVRRRRSARAWANATVISGSERIVIAKRLRIRR